MSAWASIADSSSVVAQTNSSQAIDTSANDTAYFFKVDTACCLRPSRGTVNVSSPFQAPFARANGSAMQAPDVFRSLMQRIIPCAISAMPRPWRRHCAKLLDARSVSLTHSESQELIAKVLGFRDWNVLAARIQASQPAALRR